MKNKNILIFLGICFLILIIFVVIYVVGNLNNSVQEDIPQKDVLNNISYYQEPTTGEYIIYNENGVEVMRTTSFLDVENAAKGIIYDPEYMDPYGLMEERGIQEGPLEPFVEDE